MDKCLNHENLVVTNSIDLTCTKQTKSKRRLRRTENFARMQEVLILALSEVSISPFVSRRWIKLCLSYVEFVSPGDYIKEPGRLMRTLSEHPCGLRRQELLEIFYDDYKTASFQKQESLRVCLEKIIQRARGIFQKYDLGVHYCKVNKIYTVIPIFTSMNSNNMK